MSIVKETEIGELEFEYDTVAQVLRVGEHTYPCDTHSVVVGGRRIPFWVHKDGPQVSVWLNGEVYRYELIDPRARSSAAAGLAPTGGTVKAQMPGKILQVSVREGSSVETGQNLLLMESMKMELALTAPVTGIVKKVNAAADQMVAQGDVLVEIEEE